MEESVAPGGLATLDRESLEALDDVVGGDTDVLAEIVSAFLEDAPDRLREMRDGLALGDDAHVRRAAHTLKSNALTFGALELAGACRELEERAGAGRLDGAELLASEIEDMWGRTRPAIEALLS